MYQEDPKNNKDPTSPKNTSELFFRGPLQSRHTETIHIPTMIDHKPEHGEHSRDQEQTRNDKQKDPFTYEDEEEVEINSEHLERCHKDKYFQKVIEILLNEEKEKYFLKLTQEGDKLPITSTLKPSSHLKRKLKLPNPKSN